jgi:hypothetical protein
VTNTLLEIDLIAANSEGCAIRRTITDRSLRANSLCAYLVGPIVSPTSHRMDSAAYPGASEHRDLVSRYCRRDVMARHGSLSSSCRCGRRPVGSRAR